MKKKSFNSLLIVFYFLNLTAQKSFAKEAVKGLLPEIKTNSTNEEKNNDAAFKSEILITQTEAKAIDKLKKVISNSIQQKKNPNNIADLYYRLASLHMRQAKSGRFFDLTENSGARLNKLGLKNKKSIDSLKSAVDIYNLIEKNYPQFKEMDNVLYNNAMSHAQLQQLEKSKDLYNKLISNYPKSNLIPDALLDVGEIYYNQQNFEMALEKFKLLEKYPNSKSYPYGLYKSAWSHYNLKQTSDGIDQLVRIVKLYPAESSLQSSSLSPEDKKYNLRKEALRDLTLFVGETMPSEQLYPFFSKYCSEDELGDVVLGLATLYESHSRFKEISIFGKEFIDNHPRNEFSAKIYTKLIATEETLKNRPQALHYLTKLSEHCLVLDEKNQSPCKDEFRKVSLEISKKWWEIWLKNKKNTEFSELTVQAFELLLSQEDTKSPDIISRHAYAELLFQLERYDLAQANYEKIFNIPKIDHKRKHDALYGALYSIEKQIEDTESKKDLVKNDLLTLQQQNLAQIYLKEFPQGEHSDSLAFKLGFIAYKQKKYDDSLNILNPFTKQSKNKILVFQAEDIVLDIYNIKKDYKKIQEVSDQIQKNATDDKRKKYLKQLNEEAQLSQIQIETSNETIETKIKNLKQFALANKTSPRGQKSFWQCVTMAYANNLDILGADLAIEYSTYYPQDSKNTDALKEAIKAYVDAGYLKKAIATLRQIASTVSISDPKKYSEYIETSCDLLRVNSQLPEARGCYKVLFEKADHQKKSKLLTKMIQTYSDKKNGSELAAIENEILKENIEPYATRLLITKARNLLNNGKINEAFNQSLKINSRPVDADIRAEARLIQAEILEKEFFAQSIKAKESKFSMVLALKTGKFDKAFTAYSGVIKMSKSDEIQSKSLLGIDRLYQHLIDSLNTITIPQSLSAEEQNELKNELQKMSLPFQQKRKDNLAKLRTIAKLSATESETIDWSEYSVEKTIEPRLVFPVQDKIGFYLPEQFQDGSGNNQRLPSSEKTCDINKINAASLGGCIQSKKFIEAEKISLKLTETKTLRSIGLYYLSVVADSQGETDKALWMIEKAIETESKNENKIDSRYPYFEYQKGKILYARDGINRALPHFEKSLTIKKMSRELLVMNALKAYSDTDYLEASNEFSQLDTQDLDYFKVSLLYLESLAAQGELEKARQLAQRLVNNQPKNVDVYLQQARIFEEFSGQKNEAIAVYQKAMVLTQNSQQKDWLKRKIDFLKLGKNSPAELKSIKKSDGETYAIQ